jgi:DNA-binding transcriptional regulator YhcF (GntR family)
MSWKFTGEKPVYQQIMDHIRGDIIRGKLPAGARIPAVRELAMIANVNPNTMQRALTELEREGLLVTCGTVGRFVTDVPEVLDTMRKTAVDATIRASAAQFRALGLTMEEAAKLLLELEVPPA